MTDTERLDWLESHAHALSWDEDGNKVCIRASDGAEAAGETWREAIDKVAAKPEA